MVLKIKFLFILFFSCWSIFSQTRLKSEFYFGKNPGNLRMYYYSPQKIDTTKKVPLVIVLHGCTQSAQKISDATGWNKLADSLNFMVLYPEQKTINNVGKCFNFFIGFKAKKDKGELASIKEMIDFMISKNNIDQSQVFITGMSAGGGMSNALLNAYPETFNAGALFAAPSAVIESLNSSEYVPRILILQGEEDKVVSKKQAEKILDQWVLKNQIDTNQVELYENYLDNPLLTAKYYYNNKRKLKIITLNAKAVAHKLLIDPGEDILHGGKLITHTQDINFHSTYWVADFFGLTNSKPSIFR